MRDKAREQQLLRQSMRQRQFIIFQVCREYKCEDLHNDQVFAEICRRLTNEGFELNPVDEERYNKIVSQRKKAVSSNEI